MENLDLKTIEGFGDEWSRFDQSKLPVKEQEKLFNDYFKIFPWHLISETSMGFDMGCGTGRWAEIIAKRVKLLHCVDPSVALEIARIKLNKYENCIFHNCSLDNFNVDDGSMDFGYSLGVLHHIPNTEKALNDCVKKLKCGAPFLVYLYYNFDNKPLWFKLIFKLSNIIRLYVSRLPYTFRFLISQILAILFYFPLARLSFVLEKLGMNVDNIPLCAYRNSSFYTMRTDSLDRFGTRLENRFSKKEIENMMLKSGLINISFNDCMPYWCAVGIKK